MRALLPRSPVAQLAEHPAVNRRVVGSSPTRGASKDLHIAVNVRGPAVRGRGLLDLPAVRVAVLDAERAAALPS